MELALSRWLRAPAPTGAVLRGALEQLIPEPSGTGYLPPAIACLLKRGPQAPSHPPTTSGAPPATGSFPWALARSAARDGFPRLRLPSASSGSSPSAGGGRLGPTEPLTASLGPAFPPARVCEAPSHPPPSAKTTHRNRASASRGGRPRCLPGQRRAHT